MEKEKFISKFNLIDYNNQLEKILAKKNFSEDIKNLLLSMLYKIENSYDDYSRVTGETKTKKEFLEEILQIISEDCDKIDIVQTNESANIPEEKKIITYLNTRKILYEIYQIKKQKFKVPSQYVILKPALEKILNMGYSISSNEAIRDFDGWSWNIAVTEIENIKINFIYQILKIIVGNDELEALRNSKDCIMELQERLERRYKTDLAEKIIKSIYQISLMDIIQENESEKDRLIEVQKQLQEKFDKLNDKKKYLEDLKEKKKQISDEIKKRDNIINNDKNLKKEFIARNEFLDMNHRIFSLSDLVEILEEERKELIVRIK